MINTDYDQSELCHTFDDILHLGACGIETEVILPKVSFYIFLSGPIIYIM